MPGEPWEWDETLYAGSAAYYPAGRMPYPPELPEVLRTELGLDGTGRILDVGCGPGSLTLLLAPLFESAVGIDADREMIARAQDEARRLGVRNVSWRKMRAESLPGDLGRFHVATFAQSFHWLDQPRVAAVVREMLEPDGAWVHLHATTHEGVPSDDHLPYPRPPRERIAALVTHYLGAVRRAGRTVLPSGTRAGEEDVMRAAGYAGPTRIEVGGGTVVERSADDVVASVFSLSSSTPYLFGSRLGAFERELRELLCETSPTGRFCERTREVMLVIWRPPSC